MPLPCQTARRWSLFSMQDDCIVRLQRQKASKPAALSRKRETATEPQDEFVSNQADNICYFILAFSIQTLGSAVRLPCT
eukprot:m.3259 g.3259  ORF g.3259 m.3259 type:complete len:79 (+) comp4807_c0_seq2:811-1047(+)